jgi:peptide/nickel transport system permease protein
MKKTARFLLTIFLVSSIIFFIIRIIPGDPALIIAGVDASETQIQLLREKIGTNKPLGVQYLHFLNQIIHLDFGSSLISGEPVKDLVLTRFSLTLQLAILGILLGLVLAIPLGVLSAVHRWSFWDYFGMFLSQIGMAVPGFWMGIMLLLIFSVRFPIFPLFGAESFKHLILPTLVLGFERAAIILRLVRASMIEEMSREYVITARAKGLPENAVKFKHALKNALLPIITITGIQFGYMLGGAIIIEQVFSLPGLGRLFLSGILQRDFPVIQGGVIFVSLIFSLINFFADLLYGWASPRIRIS